MKKHVDYIIVGQGLAGSALAWELTRRGKTVEVVDRPGETRASVVAAGLYNPITGKVLTKTWKADALFPFLESFYGEAEHKLNKKFLHSIPIHRPFLSVEEQSQWKSRSESDELRDFVLNFYDQPAFKEINGKFGGIDIKHSGYLNVQGWLDDVREYLISINSLTAEHFDEDDLITGPLIQYRDITGDKIIFCNGVGSAASRLFKWLPVRQLKGQTLAIKVAKDLPRIFNRGVYVVPFRDGLYNVGSTYEHPPFSESITEGSRTDILSKLNSLLSVSFEEIHQDWGIRPTTPDRRPMLGSHPAHENVIFFNGLGTKGVSLAPYFAHHLADWMEGEGKLSAEVNIYRFKTLYSG